MKQLFYTIVLLLGVLPELCAQTFNVKGTIVGAPDNQPLIGVNVVVFPLADSSNRQGTVTDLDGNFLIPNIAPGTYTLRGSYIGYQTFTRTIAVADADVSLATITMLAGATALKGVTLTAEQIRAQQMGDTSQFNASSYKTNPDANAEDLITKMPGVTTEGGTIKVNGEEVKRVLVDGKEFFGDDPNAAIKNLPAEVIDKIQVFDRQSDQAQFTGFDDGNSQKTINIVTKRGRNNGMFGKVAGGIGMDDASKDARYTLGGNLNFFNGDRRISIVALANNVNQQNFSSEDLLGVSGASSGRGGSGGNRGGRGGGGNPGGGGYSGGGDAASNFLVGQQGGITQTQSIGINYSDQLGPKLKITASYFFNRSENTNQTSLTRSYFVNNVDSALVYNENGTSHSTDFNHRASLRAEWTIDSFNSLILTPKISYQNNEAERFLAGNTTLGASIDQGNIVNRYSSENSGYNFSNNLLYRHRFAKQGRTLSAGFNTSYSSKTGNGALYSSNKYHNDTSTVTDLTDQHFDLDNTGLTLSGNLNYTEPLTKKTQLMITYNPSYNRNNSDRETFNIDGGEYIDLDSTLTNRYENRYYYQRGGIGYRYNDTTVSFNATINGQYATLEGDQTFPGNLELRRSFSDLLPMAMLNYRFSRRENIRVMYRTSTNAPNITQLQNIVDNNNPLLLRTGNPDLRQDYTHSLSVRYGKTGGSKGTGLFLFGSANFVNNYIGSSTLIAVRDTMIGNLLLNRGSQLSRPLNLDGAWNARTFITYSFPVQPIKSNFNLNLGYNFNRNPSFINDRYNYSTTNAVNGGLVIGSNISENVDFTVSYNGNYSMVKNTQQTQTDYNYYSQTTSLRFNWIFLKNAVFNTNLNHTLYSGLGEGYDRNFLLWNASLGYKFLKDRSLQADIYAFDILKQNNSISRNISDSYIEDAQTTVLQRYFLLRLTYTLRQFKGAAPVGEDGMPGRRDGGGRRGSGRSDGGGGRPEGDRPGGGGF